MNTATASLSDLSKDDVDNSGNLSKLVVERDRYRRQSEWLSLASVLYARLAAEVNLSSMIDAFSVWLMPLVKHDLIAYNNPEQERMHISCSCHGPQRREATSIAQRLLYLSGSSDECRQEDSFYAKSWLLSSQRGNGHLLLLRDGRSFHLEEVRIIDKTLEVISECIQRALHYEDLFDQARRDSLTGLPNRRVFEERIGPLLNSARRYGRPITLAMMDLDNFKQINDFLGHAEGDRALKKVAQMLGRMVRSSDLLIRMGGDEFLMVLSDTDLHCARSLALRLCQGVDQLDIRAQGTEKLGMSVGLIQWRAGLGKDEWVQQADKLLYQAKVAGRSQICSEYR